MYPNRYGRPKNEIKLCFIKLTIFDQKSFISLFWTKFSQSGVGVKMNGNRDNYTIETEVDMVAHSSASIINLYPGFLENKLQVLKLSVARRNDKPVYLLRQRGYSGADSLLEGVRIMAEIEYSGKNSGPARSKLIRTIDSDFEEGRLN